MQKTLITAHNGADGTQVNSMAFVRHALASRADSFEIDVRRLADGTLVFTHDLPDSHPRDLVTVRAVFDALRESGRGMRVNCDLKEPCLESATASLAEECGIEDLLQFSGTVSAEYCRRTGLANRVEILLNIEEYIPCLYDRCRRDPAQIPAAATEICSICRRLGISCVNANYLLATDAFLDILESSGIALSVWTVNDPGQAARFFRRSIYSLTTRNLEGIMPLRPPQA